METKKFNINPKFSQPRDFPAVFIAAVAKETAEAVYVYGHAVSDSSTCIRCGKKLEGQYEKIGLCFHCACYWSLDYDPDWEYDFMKISDSDIPELKRRIEKLPVDRWIPKAVILNEEDCDEEIELPTDHKMLAKAENQDHEKEQVKEKKNMKLASRKDDEIIVKFPYNADDVKFVKGIAGRKYNPDKKTWSVPLSAETVKMLAEAGFEIDESLAEYKA
jgi:hypothetical protein